MSNNQDSFIRLPDVIKRVGLGRSTIYQLIKEKKFPAQISLSPRTSVWTESSISNWINEQINKQKQKSGGS